MGVDLQVVAHFSRRDEVTNALNCTTDLAKCTVESRSGLVGWGLNVQLNAASFLTPLLGLFK